MKRPYYTWPEPATEYLHQNYGLYTARAIASKLRGLYGMKVSVDAVQEKARVEGLKASDAQGLLNFTDAAKELELSLSTLWNHVRRHGLKVEGHGRYKYLPEAVFKHLQEVYRKPPEPTVSIPEASRKLAYSPREVGRMIDAGKLRAYRYGDRWRVATNSIHDYKRALRRSA
jgi:excisionase family DNA binding protein